MFSYDAYKNRILRIAAIKRFIFKFKVPIIVVFSLIVASLTTFLCVKGTFTSNVAVITENIIYGEEYELKEAKALFGKVRAYEYCADGENTWSTRKPTLAGKYRVRAVTRGGFGNKRSDAVEFEILPRPVTFAILDDEIVYGARPAQIELPLIGSDKVAADKLSYEFDGFESENTAVEVKLDSVLITNAEETNVTNCYSISSAKKDVRLLDKNVTLSVALPEFVYNGKEQRFINAVDSVTQSELGADKAEFDTIIRDENGNIITAPTNAGKYTVAIVPESLQIMHENANVTSRYNLSQNSFEPHEFEVKKRIVTVKTQSAEKEYDGAPLVLKSGELAENLADGHALAYAALSEVSIIDAGETVNSYEFNVFAGENDVTANYEINYKYGTLTVTPRKIVLTAASETFEYDGEIKTNLFAASSAGANGGAGFINAGECAQVTNFGKLVGIADAGTVSNYYAPADYTVFNADGSVNGNYEITEVIAGTLTVTPRKIILTAASESFEYNGIAKSNLFADLAVSLNGDIGFINAGEYAYVSSSKFIKITDAGTVRNNYLPADYTVFNADGSVSGNYEIVEVIEGTLTVTPRRITLTSASETFEYDGEKHSAIVAESSSHENVYGVGLVGNHRAEVYDASKIIYVQNVADTARGNNAYAATDYKIYDGDGNDVSGNYNVLSVTSGTLTVKKHEFTVFTSSATRMYNGEALFKHEFSVYDSIIAKTGDSVALDETRSGEFAELTKKGTINNVLFVKVLGPDGSDCDNYEIKYSCGTLNVTERPVTVKTGSGSHVYFGSEFYVKNYEQISGEGLASGDSAVAIDSTVRKVLNATSQSGINNDTQFAIINAAGESVTDSYKITYEYGKLIVSKRPIVITTGTIEDYRYNGQPQSYTREYGVSSPSGVTDGGLCAKHYLKTDENNITTITNVGTVENIVKYFIFDGADNEVTANYEIEYLNGTITVLPCQITLISDSETFEYDGEEHSNLRASECLSNVYLSGFINEGEYAYVGSGKVIGITDAGTTQNDYEPADYKVFNADGTETNNYEVTAVIAGTLTVKPRRILIRTGSAEKVYDGDWLACPSFESVTHIASDGGDIALVTGHELELDENSITRILHTWQSTGSEEGRENELVYRVMFGSAPVSGNYEIAYEYGVLTITPRPVSVTTATSSRVYNDEEFFDGTAADWTKFDEKQKVGLLASHRLESDASTLTKIRLAGSETNILEYFVFADSSLDGVIDVTRDYAISYSYGTLTVIKRRLTIVTWSYEKEYDGYVLYGDRDLEKTLVHGDNASADAGLVDVRYGHRIESVYDMHNSIIDVGSLSYECDCVIYGRRLENGLLEDVTDSYEIKYEKGTLTITPRLIRIKVDDVIAEYDGNGYFSDYAYVFHVKEVLDGENVTYVEDWQFGLVNGHRTESIGGEKHVVTNVWDSTKYTGILNDYKYRIVDTNFVWDDGDIGVWDDETIGGFKDVTHNYKIVEIIAGTLEITPREVVVTRSDKEKEYDGEKLFGDEATGDRLLEAHKFVATGEVTVITNVWESGKQILTEFSVADQNGNFYIGGHRIDENYSLSYEESVGRLSITQRWVIVQTGSAKKTYDGIALEYDGYEYVLASGGEWLAGHYLQLDLSRPIVSLTDAGTALNERYYIVAAEIGNEIDGHTMNENYILTYDFGVLEVEQRKITVVTASAEKTYDGEPLDRHEWSVAEDSPFDLVNGHFLVLRAGAVTSSIADAGSIDNELGLEILDVHNEKYITDNYAISYRNGKLTVTPRDVYVKPADITSDYCEDGYTLYYEYYGDSKTDFNLQFVEGETLMVDAYADENGERFYGVGAGVYTVYIKAEYCSIAGGRDRVWNYNLICEEGGRFERTKRAITAFAPVIEAEYNGTEHSADLYAYRTAHAKHPSQDGIINGDLALVRPVYEYFDMRGTRISAPVQAGSYIVRIIEFENVYEDMDVLANYEYDVASFTDGSITVTKRAITVKPINGGKPYDGEAVRFGDWTANGLAYSVILGSVIPGDELDLRASFRGIIDYASGAVMVTNAESVTEAAQYFIDLDVEYAAEHNSNYDIEVNEGMYTIAQRRLRVQNSSHTAEYCGEPIFVPLLVPNENINVSDRALVEKLGHRIELNGEFSKTDAGVYRNPQSIRVFSGDADCTHNYAVRCTQGTLTILPRTLTVAFFCDSYEKEYDAKPFEIGANDYEVEGLVSGQSFDKTQSRWTNMLDAGTYHYELVRAVIKTESGKNVKISNYTLEYNRPAPVVISPKRLIAEMHQEEREYNGKEQLLKLSEIFSCAPDSAPLEEVIKSFEWSMYSNGELFYFVSAGEHVLNAYKSELKFDGIANNPNYYISEDETFTFNFKIAQYDLLKEGRTVELASYTERRLYDGTPLFSKEFRKVVPRDFPEGHEFKISSYTSVTYPRDGEVDNVLGFIICDGNGKDVSSNFNLKELFASDKVSYGKLQVTGDVILYPDYDANITYDGRIHERGGETYEWKVKGTQRNEAPSAHITFKADIAEILYESESGWTHVEQTENAGKYRIYYTNVTLLENGRELAPEIRNELNIVTLPDSESGYYMFEKQIYKRIVYVRPKNKTVAYDGTDIIEADEDVDVFYGSMASGHEYIVEQFSDVLDATRRSYSNVTILKGHVKSSNSWNEDAPDVSENYEAHVAYDSLLTPHADKYSFRATLQFKLQTVTVLLHSPEKNTYVYDGNRHEIPFDPEKRYYSNADVLENGFALFEFIDVLLKPEHYLKITKAYVSADPYRYNSWLTVKAYKEIDGVEKEIKAYNIRTTYSESSYVTVVAADVNIAVDKTGNVSASVMRNDGFEELTLNAVSNSDGVITYECALTSKYTLRIVNSGGDVSYKIFRVLSGDEIEADSRYFNVNVTAIE